ncbi:MAG: insulinase family protein [Myxococcales bacterium]|nr:insulinase family protein [Myxococcales bacterium]
MPSKTPNGPPPELAAVSSLTEHTLENGLRVRLLPDDSVPTVSYFTFFRVGSRNERPGATGISHLFEHMMFNGAKRYGPGEFDRVLESSGGTSNAYTSNDLTVYHDDFAAEALETVVDLESDRMRSLSITDSVLQSERQVVLEERRLRVENDTRGLLDEELASLAWKAHPYRWPVIGWRKDIERITRQECMEYFGTYYAPQNATVYVAGDFDPEQALALIGRCYGPIPKGPAAPGVADAEPEQKGERRARVHHPAQAPSLMVGYRAPPAKDPDTLVLDLLQYALSVGQGSRFVRELVYRKELAIAVGVDWSWRIDPGIFQIVLDLKPDSKPEQVERALFAEIDAVARLGLTDREIQKAKNNLKAHLLRELATNGGRAHAFGTYEELLGSWREGLTLPSRYQAITSEQVKAVAAKYFAPTRRAVATLVPTP